MDQNDEEKMKKRSKELASKIFNFINEHVKLKNNNDDESVMNSKETKDMARQVAIRARQFAEVIEMAINQNVVGEDIVKNLLKCFFGAFVESKREMDYEKSEGGFFSFSKEEKSENLECDNIRRLISCYSHDSIGGGYCGYSAFLGASGYKRFYEWEYNHFFDALKEYSKLINNSMELVVEGYFEPWTESAKYQEAICKCIEEAEKLVGSGWTVDKINKILKTAYIRGFIAAVSNWAIKNENKVRSYIGLLDTGLKEAMPEMVPASEQMLKGIKGLAEDYSTLLYEGREKYEDSDGKLIMTELEKDFSITDIGTIANFCPVKINKYDFGLMPNDAPGTDKRYAIQQALLGHKLIIEVQDNNANGLQGNEINLDFNSIDNICTGDISWLPQSDDDLNKTVSISIKRKIYNHGDQGVDELKVIFRKDEAYRPPDWIELACFIGLSKSIGKPFFCLSNHSYNGQGLIVYDASRIREEGNRKHLCKFTFSNEADLSQMSDEDIEYYGKLALKFGNSISVEKSPVIFLSTGNNGFGHYKHLDPCDEKIRTKCEEELKGMFFDRYIEEAKKRKKEREFKEKIDELRTNMKDQAKRLKQVSKENEELQKKLQGTESSQKLSEQQTSLKATISGLKQEIEQLTNKREDLKKRTQTLEVIVHRKEKIKEMEEKVGNLESQLKTVESQNVDKETKVKELDLKVKNLQNENNKQIENNKKSLNDKDEELKKMTEKAKELESQLKTVENQKKDNEKKVGELNSELKNLQDKNNEQEKQISILKLKDNNEKLKQMTEKVNELTSQLTNQNKEFETQKQQLDEKCDLENKLTSENNQLKEQAKTQEQLLIKQQTEIKKLTEQNHELQTKLESTNVLHESKQLHQEQKEREDVNENKKLRIELITERLENIKISNTSTILYIFAWMFQWASGTCKSYIEKAAYENKLMPKLEQLKQNLETNVENIGNYDKQLDEQLIGEILTLLDDFMPKYCDDGMCKRLANLYSVLLNLHEHDTNKVIKAFESVNNGKSYIELIKKNSVTKSREQNKSNDITNEVISLIK